MRRAGSNSVGTVAEAGQSATGAPNSVGSLGETCLANGGDPDACAKLDAYDMSDASATVKLCILGGADPEMCKKTAAGDYEGAAAAAGGGAAAAGCAAAASPELAPLCAKIGSKIVSGAISYFKKGPDCGSDWFCTQDTPEAWAHWMTPAAIDQVNKAFNIWLVSDPGTHLYMYTRTSDSGPLLADEEHPFPATTLRRAWLSLWYQKYVDTYGQYGSPPAPPPRVCPWDQVDATADTVAAKVKGSVPYVPTCVPLDSAVAADLADKLSSGIISPVPHINPALLDFNPSLPTGSSGGSSLWLWGGGAAALAFLFRKQLFKSKPKRR